MQPRRSPARRRSPIASTSNSISRPDTFQSLRLRRKRPMCEYLREVAEEGLRWRYGEEPEQMYRDRLDYELSVIERMGYSSYFLIVWDFARFARSHNIPCTARGSACGAIVSYLLGIWRCLPDEVRPAVRAVPRSQPQRTARYRYRLLPRSAANGHRLHEGEVRRRQRRPDRHVRHAEGEGGDPRCRPGRWDCL